MTITFNAFSFLKSKLEKNGITCGNTAMELNDNLSIS